MKALNEQMGKYEQQYGVITNPEDLQPPQPPPGGDD